MDDKISSLAARIARLKSDLSEDGSLGLPDPILNDPVLDGVAGNGLPSVGQNISLPWSSLLPIDHAQVLQTVDAVAQYCAIGASQSAVSIVDDSDLHTTHVNTLTPLDIGSRIDLTALVPGASGLLFGNGQTTAAVGDTTPLLALLPPESTVAVAWKLECTRFVSYQMIDPISQKSRDVTLDDLASSFTATAKGYGIGLGETASTFQLLSSSLAAPVLSLVPWPETTSSSGTAGAVPDYYRIFRATLQISCWWPGAAVPTVYPLTIRAYFVVSPWKSLIPDFSQKTNYIASYGSLSPSYSSNPTTNLMQGFNNMFTATVDNAAPALGKAATLSVLPTDKGASLPGQVKQLVTSTPQVKVQAALDLSAVLEGIVNTAASLFTGTPAAQAMTAAEIGVDKVLSSLLSIPIALDINGSSLSKTVEPLAGLPLPNMTTIQNGLGSNGLVPVNELTASLFTTADSLIIEPADTTAIKQTTTGLVGSLLPIPQFGNLLDIVRGTVTAKPVAVKITLKTKLVLPGASTPIDIYFDLGQISITGPQIPVPQLVVMARKSIVTDAPDISDLLLSVDPETSQYLPNVTILLQSLQALNEALATVSQLFTSGVLAVSDLDNGFLPWSSIADLTSALNYIVPLIKKVGVNRIAVAPFSFGSTPDWKPAAGDPHGPPTSNYSTSINLSKALLTSWFTVGSNATDESTNITSLAWIGATRAPLTSGWRMTGSLDSWRNTDILVLPSLNLSANPPQSQGKQVCAAVLDVNLPAAESIWESTPDGTQSVSLTGWNGHIAMLNWIWDQGLNVAPLRTKAVVRFRYFKLRNSAPRVIQRAIWSDKSYGTKVWSEDSNTILANDAKWTDLATECGGKISDNTQYWFGATVSGIASQALLDDANTDYVTDFSSQLEVTFEFHVDAGDMHSWVKDDSHELRT